MNERHDITLRQHEDGSNPPDLLQQIIEDVKKLAPETTATARKWIRAKGDQEEARVQEIKVKIYSEIAKFDIERQRLIYERDEARRKAEMEIQRESNDHERDMRELEIQWFKERIKVLHEIVDCIVRLKAVGIEIDLQLIKGTKDVAKGLLDDISE
jgi:hypothetical protein